MTLPHQTPKPYVTTGMGNVNSFSRRTASVHICKKDGKDRILHMVPMYDLKREYLADRQRYLDLFDGVCTDAAFSDGKYVRAFESAFAARFGDGFFAAALGSGTDALFLTLTALDVGPGDEVIVPSATFTATPGAVKMTGARPVFADCDPDTWQIDPAHVSSLITGRTKAAIGVHLYGNPFDAPALRRITDAAGIPLIEDCAQSFGAELNGVRTGCFGAAACFSFYPTKNLGAFGEGGAVLSRDRALAERVGFLKKHAKTEDGDHPVLGYNMRMSGLQGAFLCRKLEGTDAFLARKRAIAGQYLAAVGDSPVLVPQALVPGSLPSYHLFVLKTDDREAFRRFMADRGVETAVQYPVPCHLQGVFADGSRLPVTEELFRRAVSVPIYPYLTDAETASVADALQAYCRERQ